MDEIIEKLNAKTLTLPQINAIISRAEKIAQNRIRRDIAFMKRSLDPLNISLVKERGTDRWTLWRYGGCIATVEAGYTEWEYRVNPRLHPDEIERAISPIITLMNLGYDHNPTP